MAVLFVVSTPIGNLLDITYRAISTLKEVSIIACEDTRNTKILCNKYDIKTCLVSYHKFSECQKLDMLIKNLDEGLDIALVSDAGTPLISDPGEKLVDAVIKAGHTVVPIVGASAILALLAAIPRGKEEFKFIGFLPRVQGQIENIVVSMKNENIVFYESPNRLLDTLGTIAKVRDSAKIAVGRELTKKFEEIKIGTPLNLVKYYNDNVLKGEIVCMLYAKEQMDEHDEDIKEKVLKLKALNFSDKDIANILSALFDMPKNKIKNYCIKKA